MENVIKASILLTLVTSVLGQEPFRGQTPDGSERWGYTDVRPGAHMFWWLYHTTHSEGYSNRPLLIWIQGGPALSGIGLGNFAEIGPLDSELNPRETTWLRLASLLFVDSPVDTGFSYVDDESLLVTNLSSCAVDLVTMLREVLQENPAFTRVPIYIFGQSYGGKMGPAFAATLLEGINRGTFPFELDIRGIGIGNGIPSPAETMVQYGPTLFQFGLIDEKDLDEIQSLAKNIVDIVSTENWEVGFDAMGALMGAIIEKVPGLNVYNLLDPYPLPEEEDGPATKRKLESRKNNAIRFSIYDLDLTDLMNGPVREKLNLPEGGRLWDGVNDPAYYAMVTLGLLKPANHYIETLLNEGVQVITYQGTLDFICDTSGAATWMRNLRWPYASGYRSAQRLPLVNPDTKKPELFVKSHRNLHFYWVHLYQSEGPCGVRSMWGAS